MSGEFLAALLGQSRHIQELIEQSATEAGALDENAAVIEKLRDASERLEAVNRALQIEIRDRRMADHQGARNAELHDNLTGLPNRVLFKDRLEHGIAQATRHGWTLAVMFVDLDNFKHINDTYGHQAGDAVLQEVARRLAQNTRHDDTVSRYGGDEFLYLLAPAPEQKDMAIIAAKILNAIQSPCDMIVGGVTVNPRIEASIGISVFPQDGNSAAALIDSADAAMYEAKGNQSGIAFAH